MTPLFRAARNGHVDVVAELLATACDINKGRSTDDASPLYAATQKGHSAVVSLL
eukprot:SAG31_NODE_24431_length_481_cov_1.023560_1_plen_53_part_10